MGKGRRAAGIGSTGAVDGKERDDNDRAEALGDDALRRLQVHISALDVFRNYRRMLAKGKLNGGLAGSETLRWKAETAGAPSEAHFEDTAGVGFEKHATIGVGDRDG